MWSSTFNTRSDRILSIANAKGGMLRQARQFGKLAKALLKKHNNTLPEKYACSDSRNTFKYQRKPRNGRTTRRRRGGWRCFQGCKKHKDATLAQFAILNF